MDKIKVSAVSFLNTKCFVKGLQQSDIMDQIELSLDVPSSTAQKLLDRQVDIALVPVAILPQLDTYKIISNYGICCDGSVSTVCVYSNVPIVNLNTIIKDPNSKTSNALLRIIMNRMQLNIELVDHAEWDDETCGRLIIGDAAIHAKETYSHEYDLGKSWFQITQHPFVFATWVTTRELSADFINAFNEALGAGLSQIQNVIDENTQYNSSEFSVEQYLRSNIVYPLTTDKIAGLNYFFNELELLKT